MSFLNRNGLALRGFAVLITAYCVLASGRALIPGLCGTLADLDRRNDDTCCQPQPTCCDAEFENHAAVIASHAQSHVCAFCTLVHTAAQPVTLDAVSAPLIPTPLQLAVQDTFVADPTSAGCFLRRAPPMA